MPIEKRRPWGRPEPIPAGAVIVRSDAEARAVVERARRASQDIPVLGLAGGDLCRTLGGPAGLRGHENGPAGLGGHEHGPAGLGGRGGSATAFSVDVGAALVDGRLYWFVAHLVARDRWWGNVVAVMNAQWRGDWQLGPRAHPNDGLLDVYEAKLGWSDRLKVRSRLGAGAHLPHPGVTERRVAAAQIDLERGVTVELDGVRVGPARHLSVRVEADAIRVFI